MTDHYDVLVLGGGAAGCVLAGRLSENADRSVCLVEAGPDYGPFAAGRWPADVMDANWLALDSHRWERADEDDRSQIRAKVLGGCSAHNACVVYRGAPSDYDEWGAGWTNDDLTPYLDRAEVAIRTRAVGFDDLSPWHRAFQEAAGDGALGHPVNIVDGVRWNAAFAYIDPARPRPNLTIRAETLVNRVATSDGRATGAVTSAGEVEADVVVVSASAYGSPGILLRSGIGPADELERHRIPLVAELPVGEGLTDHVGTGAAWEPSERLVRETDAYQIDYELAMAGGTVRWRSTSCAPELHDVFIFPALEPGPEISAAVFAMKPWSRGSVRLTARQAEAPLAIDHGLLRDPRDADVLAEGFAQLRELVASDAVAPYVERELRPGPDVDADEHVRPTARGFFHPVGTCAIGRVVDADCRVRGFENLYVVDASVMPTIPRVNTHLSTLAIAERMAERL